MAYIQAQVDAEDIILLMTEDGSFAFEMWNEIGEKLHMGLLLDQAVDLISAGFTNRDKLVFISDLRLLADSVENSLEYLTDGSGELDPNQ